MVSVLIDTPMISPTLMALDSFNIFTISPNYLDQNAHHVLPNGNEQPILFKTIAIVVLNYTIGIKLTLMLD